MAPKPLEETVDATVTGYEQWLSRLSRLSRL